RWDAVVVGGGVAGLAAALWLARYRRSVCVYDSAEPRNEPAWAVHGYPGLVDPSPTELRRRLYEQAVGAGAVHATRKVLRISGARDAFRVEPADVEPIEARRVILAYGLIDRLPDIPGVERFYGTSVFHCPDCDGPEVQNCSIGVVGWDRHAAALALYLQTWTQDVVLLAHGHTIEVNDSARAVLADAGIDIRPERLQGVDGNGARLMHVNVANGNVIELDALFFHLGTHPRADLAEQLACGYDDDGYVAVDRGQETTVAGVHAAGDITGHPHLAVTAAAAGVHAALSIHRSLLPDARRV
ncbi:MAG: NAD(P)/FAD-dependent oxidoreductase, partial [Longimicrobiales bacterium]